MGFQPNRKIYVLDFTGTELDGLTVRARATSLGTFLKLTGLAESANDAPGADQIAAIGELVEGFSKVLVSWDLLDEIEQPVPTSAAGINSQEFGIIFTIITAWIHATAGVSAPLSGPPSSGPQSVAVSMPMETLSPSPES